MIRRSSQQTRQHARKTSRSQRSDRSAACSAATASAAAFDIRSNKPKQINALTGYDAILTWSDAVSMVRAAFEGDGASFPSTAASFRVSTAWLTARTTAEMEIAINRPPMKPRFPQGSEVWITGCPKFGTAAKSGLTNPEAEVETVLPEPRRWRSVSGFPRSWSRALSSERLIGWGFDRLLSTSPFGLIVFFLLGFVAGVVNVVRSAGVAPDKTGR